MFLGRKMPEAAKKLIRRTVSAIPDIFRNSQNEPVDYKALVQDLKKDFYKELAEVYPEYKIIRKEEKKNPHFLCGEVSAYLCVWR